jgi:hypothetical protein
MSQVLQPGAVKKLTVWRCHGVRTIKRDVTALQ